MTKSIIIGVLLSLVIWALTFDSFFDQSRLALTLAVAVGIGVIMSVLLTALKKPDASAPSSGILLVVVALGTIGILYGLSVLIPARKCSQPTPPVVLTCGPAAANPVKICADRDTEIEWVTDNIADGITVKVHDFKRKRLLGGYSKRSPLLADPGAGNNNAPIKGRIKNDKKNHGDFKYSVTCTPGNTEDPMIEVPK